jgi:hypothetical protein
MLCPAVCWLEQFNYVDTRLLLLLLLLRLNHPAATNPTRH